MTNQTENRLNKQRNKSDEVGRTMVEMFAVVVVIGALSILGLGTIGETQDHIATNNVVQAVMQESAERLTKREYTKPSNKDVYNGRSITDMEKLLPEGASLSSITQNQTQIKMVISGLDEAVCQKAASSKIHLLKEAACSHGTVSFEFMKVDPRDSITPNPNPGNPDSNPGSPDSNPGDSQSETCTPENCTDGECIQNKCCPTKRACSGTCCPDGRVCQNGVCVADCIPPCGVGEVCREGLCALLCDPPCAENETCQDGYCIAQCDRECPVESLCQNGDCICQETGTPACGDICCADGMECVNGSCVNECVKTCPKGIEYRNGQYICRQEPEKIPCGCPKDSFLGGRDKNTCHLCSSTAIDINMVGFSSARRDRFETCQLCAQNGQTKRYIAFGPGPLLLLPCVLAKDCPEGTYPDDVTGYCKCRTGINTDKGCQKPEDIASGTDFFVLEPESCTSSNGDVVGEMYTLIHCHKKNPRSAMRGSQNFWHAHNDTLIWSERYKEFIKNIRIQVLNEMDRLVDALTISHEG